MSTRSMISIQYPRWTAEFRQTALHCLACGAVGLWVRQEADREDGSDYYCVACEKTFVAQPVVELHPLGRDFMKAFRARTGKEGR